MKISSLLLLVLGAAIGKEEDVMCALQGRDSSKLSGLVASNHSKESDDGSGSRCYSPLPGFQCVGPWLLMGKYDKRINIDQTAGRRRRNPGDRRRRESERRRRQPADCASAQTLGDAKMVISLQ